MRTAGDRRFTVSVEEHNGNAVEGQPTFAVDTDWNIVAGMSAVPASYEGVSGGETIRGMKMDATATGLVTVISTPRTRQITTDMRLRLGERKLNVVSALDIEGRQREVLISVKEQL